MIFESSAAANSPTLIDAIHEINPGFETLDDTDAQMVITTSSSEIKCLTLLVTNDLGVADSTTLRKGFIERYKRSTVAYKPTFSSSSYKETAKQQVRLGALLLDRGYRSAGTVNRFALSTHGEELFLPWAVAVLDWETRNPVRLKEFWGEPRTLKPGERSNALATIALFTQLNRGEASVGELKDTLKIMYAGPDSESDVSNALKKFLEHKYVEKTGNEVRVREPYTEAIQQFIDIFLKMVKLDPEFLEANKHKAKEILEDPTIFTMLLRRSEYDSGRTAGARRDYRKLAGPLLGHINSAGGSLPMSSINQEIFPALTKQQLVKLRAAVRAGRLAGVAIMEVGEPRSIQDTSHILVIASD